MADEKNTKKTVPAEEEDILTDSPSDEADYEAVIAGGKAPGSTAASTTAAAANLPTAESGTDHPGADPRAGVVYSFTAYDEKGEQLPGDPRTTGKYGIRTKTIFADGRFVVKTYDPGRKDWVVSDSGVEPVLRQEWEQKVNPSAKPLSPEDKALKASATERNQAATKKSTDDAALVRAQTAKIEGETKASADAAAGKFTPAQRIEAAKAKFDADRQHWLDVVGKEPDKLAYAKQKLAEQHQRYLAEMQSAQLDLRKAELASNERGQDTAMASHVLGAYQPIIQDRVRRHLRPGQDAAYLASLNKLGELAKVAPFGMDALGPPQQDPEALVASIVQNLWSKPPGAPGAFVPARTDAAAIPTPQLPPPVFTGPVGDVSNAPSPMALAAQQQAATSKAAYDALLAQALSGGQSGGAGPMGPPPPPGFTPGFPLGALRPEDFPGPNG